MVTTVTIILVYDKRRCLFDYYYGIWALVDKNVTITIMTYIRSIRGLNDCYINHLIKQAKRRLTTVENCVILCASVVVGNVPKVLPSVAMVLPPIHLAGYAADLRGGRQAKIRRPPLTSII